MTIPDDATGAAADTLPQQVMALADKHADKVVVALRSMGSNGMTTSVTSAVVRASLYEFMLEVLDLVEEE